MSHTFHQLYFHFVWGTHSRYPAIDRVWRPQLLTILNEEVKKRGGFPLRHNAMPEHVHLLVRLQPALAPASFIGQVKAQRRSALIAKSNPNSNSPGRKVTAS